jgi:FkbM family methyltransferase
MIPSARMAPCHFILPGERGRFVAKLWYYFKSIFELLFGFKNPLQVVSVFLKPAAPGRMTVHLRHPDLRLLVRGKMDIWSVKETFIDRFYTKYGCELGKNWTIIDIGAAIGEFSLYAAANDPGARIIAYEPFPESVEIFKKNLEMNGISTIKIIPKAVWKTTTRLELDISLQEPLQITSGVTEISTDKSIRVEAVSLADVLRSNKLSSVDLVKLDCEGAEFDILLGSRPETVKAFKRIVMEYHDGADGRHHAQLESHLQSLGYRVTSRENVVHPEIGYLYAERTS